MPYEHPAAGVIMSLTRRMADAIESGEEARQDRLWLCLRTLAEEYPEAKAEVDRRYPVVANNTHNAPHVFRATHDEEGQR